MALSSSIKQSRIDRRMDSAAAVIRKIINNQELTTLFQPIFDPRSKTVFGFEALSRGPSSSWLHSPQHLFEAARRSGLRVELEFCCVAVAARSFVAQVGDGKLFINISPDSIYEEPRFAERCLREIVTAGLSPERCVIELTEECLLDDYAMLRSTLQQLREAGCEFAIDDLGAGSSGLRTWSELRPDYVKIDRYFITNIDSDSTKYGFVRSIVDLSRAIGCRVIAEGVETPGECRELIELGVDRLQGYLFGRPEAVPSSSRIDFDVHDIATISMTALSAEHLAVPVAPVAPDMKVSEFMELLRNGTSRDVLAVVNDGKPVGMVRRQSFFALMSKPLYPEIYNKKTVSAIMEPPGICIDSALRLEQVSRLVTNSSNARWTDEFIITRDGQYLGIGQTMDLLRQITTQQVQIAKHSNPLTLLPGNGPIRDCVNRLLSDQRHFIVCYVDVDNFKAYNDVYGYAQGDEVLKHLAEQLKIGISPRIDFLGHIGGDDFVLIMRSKDWRKRLQDMIRCFTRSVPGFYSAADAAKGHIVAADRNGELRQFPLMSLSLAALDSLTVGIASADDAASLLVTAKKSAKHQSGNSLALRNNEGVHLLIA
jgi:EAL domain-containing protein (putative c-di-GMP-specific phosphodiesterase class I)/GGDEF domain-containing protein/CBS domain-containing protein